MTKHPIVPLELLKDRIKPRNKRPKNRLVLNLKSNGVELSFYMNWSIIKLVSSVCSRTLLYFCSFCSHSANL
ncbi:hypothetical protein [Lactobacillus delbrueckii]|uniref:hypothetical protein n=1 Tax=Lactobacillus delbrueckii TaxID=1584 RepID=UPI001E351FE6|nr:hypothetical protein [Lactobacillus delbrueckii]MCD5534291.1 hypothetical protein [Lactobacillus delbrueckii subsp. lactis]